MASLKNVDSRIVRKSVFAVAVIAIVGSTSAAFAVTNQNSNQQAAQSGYGNDGATANEAIDNFESGYIRESNAFRDDVTSLASTARTQLADNGGSEIDTFVAKFDDASSTYDNKVADAGVKFRAAITDAASKAETKDQFIDSFNRAKAEYFDQLEMAKNDFAAVVSNLGDNANQIKDSFIGGYNNAKGTYGNDLEGLKNQLATTLG